MASWAMGPVASILPSIVRDLGVGVTAAGWIMSAYFLMLVGTVLVMGRLGDLFGHDRVFSLGVALFTAASVLCGLAPSFVVLLAGRGLQGVGSSMIFATSLAILAAAIPARNQGRAIGTLFVAASAASLIGTGVATWSVQHLSWPWAFFAAVPVGVLGTVLGLRLRLPRVRLASRRIDWAGAALLFATISAAMLGLNHLHEGSETYQEGAPYHLGMHLLAVGFFVAFLKVEQRAEAPLLGFRLLRSADFSSAILGNGIAHMSMLAASFLLPFLLERGRLLTPAFTGQLVISQQVAMVTCSLALGYLYDRTRSPALSVVLMALIAAGLLTYGLLGGALPFVALLAVAALLGGALGGFTTVNNAGIMALAPQHQHGFASGLIETTRQLGHGIGVSLSSSFMAAALIEVTNPGPEQYVHGFQQAALAMGTMTALGVVALLWPSLQGRLGGPVRAMSVSLGVSSERPVGR